MDGEVLDVMRDFAKEVADYILFLHQGLIEEDVLSTEEFGEAKSERLSSFLENVL